MADSVNPEIETLFKRYGAKGVTRGEDGTLVVEGSMDLNSKVRTDLPFKHVGPYRVRGNFACAFNRLTSLAGAPAAVGGDFTCSYNQLTSLAGAPAAVGGDFSCHNNQLASLAGGPAYVGGGFFCDCNPIAFLGLPEGHPIIAKLPKDLQLLSGVDAMLAELDAPERER